MSLPSTWNNRIAAVALGLGLAMTAVIGPCWWSIARYHNPTCTVYKPDFVSLYAAAKLMWTDKSSLYDLEQQRLVQYPIDPTRGDWVLPYFYPPFFALALVPLAWLSFSGAFITMTLINLILLTVAIKILINKLGLNLQQTNWLILTTFCNYGVHYALLEAQTSFIALILLVLYVTALSSPAPGKAGIWSGLMAFKPQLTMVPLVVLIGKSKWLAVGLAIAVIGLLGLVSLFALGFEGLGHYFSVSRQAISTQAYFPHMRPEQPERMHNLRALTYFFFTTPWRDYVWWASTVAVITRAILYNRAREGSNEISARQWVTILAALILATPHLHDHDLTLLIVPFAFVLKQTGDIVPPAAALTLVVLGILPLINTIAYPHLPPLVPLVLLLFLIFDWRRALSIAS